MQGYDQDEDKYSNMFKAFYGPWEACACICVCLIPLLIFFSLETNLLYAHCMACHVAFCKDWCRAKNLPFYVTQPNRIVKVFSDF